MAACGGSNAAAVDRWADADGPVANHLTSSQPTAKSGDGDGGLARPPKVSDECDVGRPTDGATDRAPPVMGNGHVVSRLSGGAGRSAEERAEVARSLLYEQNMCTFENFCERRNSQPVGQETEEDRSDRQDPAQDASDVLGNFCTLRRGMRRQEEPVAGGGGGYWTLKRKKLQLNRKFVESFLEDPNAQVADYLSELDAYLDEIDDVEEEDGEDESDDGCSTGVSEAPEDDGPSVAVRDSAEVTGQDQSLQYYQTPGGGGGGARDDSAVQADAGGTTAGDRVVFGDIKHFCTLPKRKRSQVLSAFKRGASLRRTFVAPTSDSVVPVRKESDAVPEEQGEAVAGPTETESRKGADARQHPISWHRNSMRRKHLIELPEQIVVDPLDQPLSDPSAIGGPEDGDDFCSISTLPVDELPNSSMDSEVRPAMINVPALRVALPLSPTPSSTWEPSAPPASSPSPPQPLETDLDGGGWDERVVPRQTGRRTQSQPRLVSITAVRDEATNELVIRTNSVPGDRASAPSLALAEESQVQQHQAAQQQHRYGAVESEGSSMGSSRNPSPVSLLSTTTYSSIASGGDNADNRRSETNHEAGAGVPTRQSVSNGTQQIGEVATIATADGGSWGRHRGEEQWRSTAAVAVATDDDDGTANEAGASATQQPEDPESSDPDVVVVEGRRSSRRNDGRPKARWPHAISRSLATTFCTVGLFNLSRFAVFSVHFGANFVVQFVLFSLLFGIPMMWLQMVLGARIRGGPVTMWRISPICKGIGIALLVAQALVALYSAISLAWVLVYFRDAFTVRNERYRWQEPFEFYRGGGPAGGNQSFRLSDTVADYFNGVVLQRYHLRVLGASSQTSTGAGRGSTPGVSGIGAIRFQLAFNLAILWTLVFVALCRGIRSLGKVAVGLFLIATAGLVAVCAKFLTFISYDSVQSVFPATDWQDFFLNSRSWMCAAQETFLTWGLLGVSIYSLNCRSNRKGACNGRTRRELRRDAFLVAFITLAVLLLAAVLGSACVQILNTRGYYYFPGSYENLGTNVFLLPASQPLPPQHATMPNRWLIRYSMVVGESFKRPYADPSRESGYQVLRLATELLPAALATAAPGPGQIPAIWGLIAYLTLALFGLGQLCVAWKPIAGAIGDAPSSILLSCVTGLLLGMPLATEGGITIVYYLDTILGAAWWVLLLWIGHILALFLVRGRPFTSDILVNDLKLLQSFSAFVAFAWNFLLPIGLIFLCILQYRLSNSAALFNWGNPGGNGSASYWPLWARQTGGFVQVSFLLLVPIVMVVQIYRYLCRGPPDILDRVDLLLRPPVDGDNGSTARGAAHQARRPAFSHPVQQSSASGRARSDGSDPNAAVSLSLDTRGSAGEDDAPPKYTPPPSYTTATGARIAKMLRNSIRRSVRRLMGESSGGGHRQRVALPQSDHQGALGANPAADGELPPDYCSVLQQFGGPESMEMARPPRMLFNSATLGSGRRYRSLVVGTDAESQTAAHSLSSPHHQLTASDVRQILRPATITGTPVVVVANTVAAPPPPISAGSASAGFTQTLCNTLLRRGHSMENLVLGAAPIGDSSIITLDCNAEDDRDDARNGGGGGGAARQNRSRNGMGNDSVI